MSQYPPPLDPYGRPAGFGGPIPYAVPVGPAYPAPRPTTAVVLGVLGILFAVFLGGVSSLVLLGIYLAPGPNPVMEEPVLSVLIPVGTALRVATAGLLLASAVGLLSLRPWARRGMLGSAVLLILLQVGDVAATVGWLLPLMERAPRKILPPGATPTTFLIGPVIGWVIWTVYAVLLLVLLNRPSFKAFFVAGGPIPLPPYPPGAPGVYPPPGVAGLYSEYPVPPHRP